MLGDVGIAELTPVLFPSKLYLFSNLQLSQNTSEPDV